MAKLAHGWQAHLDMHLNTRTNTHTHTCRLHYTHEDTCLTTYKSYANFILKVTLIWENSPHCERLWVILVSKMKQRNTHKHTHLLIRAAQHLSLKLPRCTITKYQFIEMGGGINCMTHLKEASVVDDKLRTSAEFTVWHWKDPFNWRWS